MSAKSDEEKAEDEGYMSFGDKALAGMSGIFGVSEAKAKEPEIDAYTYASKPITGNLLEKKKDDYLLFDGFRLTWYRDNKPLKSWKAMSGDKDYQDKKYTGLKNHGPLPEGTWNVNQEKFQNYDDQAFWKKPFNYTKYVGFNKGQWSGGKPAWGNHRVWLKPAKGTDSQGRTELSIHGGWIFGSAGCIDLADGMDDFADMYQKYGKDMKLKVKYLPNFGK